MSAGSTRTATRSSQDTSSEIPFLQTANHYFVCATLSREPDAMAGRIVGDLLVLKASAWHQRRGERLRFAVENYQPRGWRQPLRAAQPPRDLRADPPLDGAAPGVARSRLSAAQRP